MAAVDFDDILEAFETVSFGTSYEKEAFLCKETGRIYYYFEDMNDMSDELPDDIHDNGKYIQIPHKNELGLGKKLPLSFVQHELPGDLDCLCRIFRKKGAYSRFKDLLEKRGILEKWYEFEAEATDKALCDWCEINSVKMKRD